MEVRRKLNSKSRIIGYWDDFQMCAEMNNETLVFPTQKRAADEITILFMEKNYLVITMCAPCQWGKTGTILQIVINLSTYSNIDKLIPYENIYIITGLSSTDWKEQTTNRFPKCFADNILHLPELGKVLPERMHKCKNALFIIDECHIANASNQSIANAFKKCEIFDFEYMKENNIKILQVSATPDNAAHDMRSWGDHHQMYIPDVPESYVSFENLFDWKRVYPKLDMRDDEQLERFFNHVFTEFNVPKYHILRVNARHDVHDNIKTYADKYNVTIVNHDCSDRIEEVDNFLSKPPTVHTLIIIKQMWKAAKTLNDEHIGIVHESVANTKNFSTEIQGLCGRLCGHGKIRGFQGPLLFCDLKILRNYIDLMKCNFNYKRVMWRSDRIKSNGYGRVDSTKSYLNATVVGGLTPAHLVPVEGRDYKYKIIWVSVGDFKGISPQVLLSEVKKAWNVNSHLKFDETNCNNGFYMCSTTQGKKVFTKAELLAAFENFSPISNLGVRLRETNYIIPKGSRYTRMYVCYDDLTAESARKPIICARIFEAKKDCDFSETLMD